MAQLLQIMAQLLDYMYRPYRSWLSLLDYMYRPYRPWLNY